MTIPEYTTALLPLSGRLARRIPGVGTQERPMSRNYQITDPGELASKLTSAGFKCEVVRARARRGKPSWNSILHARDMSSESNGYVNEVTIGCSHDGRHALPIQPGALRVACFNQFKAPAVWLHHTSQEIREFWQDPATLVWSVINHGRAVAEKLESLRHVGDGNEIMNTLAIAAPRLMIAAGKKLETYQRQDGMSFWAVIQAFSETRKPGLLRLADEALNQGWEETKMGVVTSTWERILCHTKP